MRGIGARSSRTAVTSSVLWQQGTLKYVLHTEILFQNRPQPFHGISAGAVRSLIFTLMSNEELAHELLPSSDVAHAFPSFVLSYSKNDILRKNIHLYFVRTTDIAMHNSLTTKRTFPRQVRILAPYMRLVS